MLPLICQSVPLSVVSWLVASCSSRRSRRRTFLFFQRARRSESPQTASFQLSPLSLVVQSDGSLVWHWHVQHRRWLDSSILIVIELGILGDFSSSREKICILGVKVFFATKFERLISIGGRILITLRLNYLHLLRSCRLCSTHRALFVVKK